MTVIDDRQINQWYKLFQTNFIRIGTGFGYSMEETLDLIDQFFLELLEKKINTTSIENPQAYLSTAFRRRLIDDYRKTKKARLAELRYMEDTHVKESFPSFLEEAEANLQLQSRLKEAFDKLPNRCKRVIKLKYFEQLTIEQIAKQTDLTKRSVYNNIFEGIKLLRVGLATVNSRMGIVTFFSLLIAPCMVS